LFRSLVIAMAIRPSVTFASCAKKMMATAVINSSIQK